MSVFLPPSVPDEFKDASFLEAVRSAKNTLRVVETGLSAKSEFELYFQTGASLLDFITLYKRAQNVDIRYSKIRSVYWKVFLSLVGGDTSTWLETLTQKRDTYATLKQRYISSLHDEDASSSSAANLVMDNPLLSAVGGRWDQYYKDRGLRDTIVLDIDRTYPEDDFFVHASVQTALTDILFVYCKENEWIGYKQGMNELIATLFMVNAVQSTISPYVDDDSKMHASRDAASKDTAAVSLWETVQDIRHIEADTYWMFVEVMSVLGQYFHNAGGKAVPPIVERSKRIQEQFLRQMDAQLAQHLLKVNLTPQLYGMKWIRLFFSREFHLRDVCVVWDAIFAAYAQRKQLKLTQEQKGQENDASVNGGSHGVQVTDPLHAVDHALEKPRRISLDFRFVDYMACSMLLFIRHQLIDRDQSHCLKRVMRYPPIEDIASLIERAYTIRDQIERRGKSKKQKQNVTHAHSHSHAHHANLNISDRWNQFSRTVTSAMTTYAEDVKNLMGGQRRTLKSRMQFEYALGTKMGDILNSVQQTINEHREQLSGQTPPSSQSTEHGKIDTPSENEQNIQSAVDDPLSNADNTKNESNADQKTDEEKTNPLMIIEEALAELKLVRDALLGNLDETQLESWLDWTFVEPSPEPHTTVGSSLKLKASSHQQHSQHRRKKPSAPPPQPGTQTKTHHKRNLSASGLPPPKKTVPNN